MSDDELRSENERLLEFLYLCPVGLAQVGPRGDVDMMNSMGAQLLMPLADGPQLANLFDVLGRDAPELRNLVRLHTSERGTICEGLRVKLGLGADGRRPEFLSIGLVKIDGERLMAVVQDITATVKQERLLFADKQRFQAIFEGMRDAMICTLDELAMIATWNSSGERLFGLDAADAEGKPFATLADLDESVEAAWPSLLTRVRQFGWGELEAWYTPKGGERFWGEGVIAALRDETGAVTGFSVVLRDMTERKLAAEKLIELATKDSLTGLANRRHFFEYAEGEFARWTRYGGALSVLMLDGDRFKNVNDTYGHGGGDEVLKDIASVIGRSVRASDLAARYGGEEFIILLPATAAEGALALAERIRATVESGPVAYDGRSIAYTVSLGAAAATSSMKDVKALIAAADAALYEAKAAGRNRTVLRTT